MSFVDLPTIYVRQTSGNKTTSDVTASLVIQRIHYHFGQLSNISMAYLSSGTITPQGTTGSGNSVYQQTLSLTPSNRYKSDHIMGESNVTMTSPIYQRNSNFDHLIFSNHPGPCTLHSITWEGDYTPKFHKRV